MHRRRLLLAAGVVALLAGAPAAASAAPSAGPACREVLDEPERGPAAVAELGTDLAVAADRNDMSRGELRETLREDETMWLDACGRMFAVEPGPGGAAPPADATLPEGAPPSEAETFALHSRPGSNRVMYLDFHGRENITGTAWNTYASMASFTAKPFTLDADETAWSAAELAYVEEVWKRVAEDYAAFDVDVTTEDPGTDAITRDGAGDTRFGTRVMFTRDNGWLQSCGCGGIAYIGVFNTSASHAYYQPAWVYAQWDAKTAAEGASHEAGHNLGLQHQGYKDGDGAIQGYYTGHGAWAPIMGVGYYRPVTQWSASEFQSASTPSGGTQDDLARISTYGLDVVADDHAASLSTAATPIADGQAERAGVIATRTDVDTFRFSTGGGPVQIAAAPVAVGPNLDIALALHDADGDLVASSDPSSAFVSASTASGLDASIEETLPAGTYYLQVRGSAAGDPLSTGYSDYGSTGAYTVSVASALSIATAALPEAQVGRAYEEVLAASGGTGARTWSASGLPDGLSLTADGTLTGTPTTAGQSTVTVTVADGAGGDASATLELTVLAAQTTPAPPETPSVPSPTPPALRSTTPPPTTTTTPTTSTRPDRRRAISSRTSVRYRGRAVAMTLTVRDGVAAVTSPRLQIPRGHAVSFRVCLASGAAKACRVTTVRAKRRAVTRRLLAPSLEVADAEAVTATVTARRTAQRREQVIGRARVPAA